MQPEDLSGQPQVPPADLLAGRYRVSTRLLGRGALADVWAGVDEAQGRPVAVKTYRPGMEMAEQRRFAREVRTLTGLSHPHLISLYDAGEAEGRAYLVMRQISGGTLAAEVRSLGALPADVVRRMGAQMAAALAYVHARGIVHRDVKPANILLDASGQAVLADFGIARLVNGTQVTSTGVTVGTAAYLSPEQVRGRAVGPAADVYALGLVMLEALTGWREYPGDPIEAAVARLHRDPAVPEGLPYGLSDLLREMTLDEPALRPSAQQVAERLGTDGLVAPALVPGQALDVAQPAEPPRSKRTSVRRPARWIASAAVALAATAAAVLGLHAAGSTNGTGTGAGSGAPASTSSGPTGQSTRSSSAPTQAAAPTSSSVGPASLPRPAVSVATVTGRHAVPPGQVIGHGKGHASGHGKGAHKPHG